MNIDYERCRHAMEALTVSGNPSASPGAQHACQNEGGRPRHKQIAEAISLIQRDGATALIRERLYVKNYASFGDQSRECEYGMSPRHGSVVFSIEKTSDARRTAEPLGDDHVYLLECVRDAGPYTLGRRNGHPVIDNLCDAIKEKEKAMHDVLVCDAWLGDIVVEPHFTPA